MNNFYLTRVMISGLLIISQSALANCPESKILSDLPPGSYLYQLTNDLCDGDLTCVATRVEVVINPDGTRTLVYKESHLADVDRYVKEGFDITLEGKNLGLKPGKPDRIVPLKKNKKVKSSAGRDSRALNDISIIKQLPVELPATCLVEKTDYRAKNSLLETTCKNRKGDSVKTVLPRYDTSYCSSLKNEDGHLVCDITFSLRLYQLYEDWMLKEGVRYGQDQRCETTGGEISYSAQFGRYLCGASLLEGVELPEGHILLWFDPERDVLITVYSQLSRGLPLHTNLHMHALVNLKKCITAGLRLNQLGNYLYCEQKQSVTRTE